MSVKLSAHNKLTLSAAGAVFGRRRGTRIMPGPTSSRTCKRPGGRSTKSAQPSGWGAVDDDKLDTAPAVLLDLRPKVNVGRMQVRASADHEIGC
jgi:hypothetical protein